MAEGMSADLADAILDALCRGVAWTPPAELWVQLHVSAPGVAGTAGVAVETDRKQALFATASSAGSIANTTAISWTNVAGSEDYTHCTLWSASIAGDFIASGSTTSDAVIAGNNFTINVSGLVISIPTAS